MAEHVTIFEMGPRDGLQNEKRMIAIEDKVRLIDMLSETGIRKIEATSFVSPKWVPQLADAADVMAEIKREPGIAYTALTPNLKGYERAVDAKVDEVAVFAAASETFSQKNTNCTIAESLERFEPIMIEAREIGMPVRGYVSVVTDCPYEGEVDPAVVARVAKDLMAMGCYEVSLGDTIGAATPESIRRMLDAVLQEIPADKLGGHYHDTQNRALENIEVSLEMGVRIFDASIGGLGGCPYAPGAKGNVATEAVVDLVTSKGYETGIDASSLSAVAKYARTLRSDMQAAE